MRGFCLAAILLLPLSTAQAGSDVPWPGPLVDPEWLAANRQGVIVIDIRSDATLEPGAPPLPHIPDAVLLPWSRVTMEREENWQRLHAMTLDRTTFGALMTTLGIANDDGVAITTPGDRLTRMIRATRLYWTFKAHGHEKVAILDGGNALWARLGKPMESGPGPQPAPKVYHVPPVPPLRAATLAELTGSPLWDVREAVYYSGATVNDHHIPPRGAGHIPGALNLPASLMVDLSGGAGRFRPPEAVREEADLLDVNVDDPAIVYCDVGNYASLAWFVLHERLGNRNIRLFDGSMHQWSRDPDRPVTRGDAP